jgi:uncharacterized membrane protein YeaQ/YmgE (transglycosylase-associated protein family)
VHLPTLFQPHQSLAIILLAGLLVGWIAAKFMSKYGMGIVGDVIVGVSGAYIGNWRRWIFDGLRDDGCQRCILKREALRTEV